VYFYELHEGDEEVFSDVLLATENEMDADEFFELVQSIRRSVQDTYEDDTLIEAIAAELERDHEFVYVSDQRLTAAVNVSVVEEENVLISIDQVDAAAADRVADPVSLALRAQPAGLARLGHRPQREEILVGDGLSPDETTCEVGVDRSGRVDGR